MREHQLVSRHIKFGLIYISSLPKSIGTEKVSYRSGLSQHQCTRGDLCRSDLSHRVSQPYCITKGAGIRPRRSFDQISLCLTVFFFSGPYQAFYDVTL